MARTTLSLDPLLRRRLGEKARREGRTLEAIANELLQQGLARRERPGDYALKIEGWDAQLQVGVDVLDRDRLFARLAQSG